MGLRTEGEGAGDVLCPSSGIENAALKRAFTELLATRGDELRRYIQRLSGDAALADDVLQEVSLVALRASVSLDEIDDLMAWSKGVARYKLLRMRKHKSREVCTASVDDLVQESTPDCECQALSRQLLDRVLPQLRESSADLLLRRHILEENASEIGSSSGRSPAAVRMKLKRVLSSARSRLTGRS